MPFAAPTRLKPALCLLLAAAILWLPLSGSWAAGSAKANTEPAGEHTVGMSAPLPLALESASRLAGLPQPERRTPTDELALAGHRHVRVLAIAYRAARQLAFESFPPGRSSLIHWQRLQLEGG